MDNVIIIIPARLAASRLPNKPILDICGISMIKRVINQAITANIAPVYVATPDIDIFNHVKETKAKVVITGSHHQSGTDRIAEALDIIDPKKNYKYIINLQGDLPTIDPKAIIKLVESIKSTEADIITLATEITNEDLVESPDSVKIVMSMVNKQALYFSRSKIPYNGKLYLHHIGTYGYKRESLERFISFSESKLEKIEKLEQLRALENNMKINVEIIDEIPLSVDTADDLQKVIEYIKSMPNEA